MTHKNQKEREKETERGTETNVERDKRTKGHSELGFRLIELQMLWASDSRTVVEHSPHHPGSSHHERERNTTVVRYKQTCRNIEER